MVSRKVLFSWLQAKVRKSHNIVILSVGSALFVAALFNCFRIILNPILKETMFPVLKKKQTKKPTNKKPFTYSVNRKTILLEPDKLRTHFLNHTNCRAIKISDIS